MNDVDEEEDEEEDRVDSDEEQKKKKRKKRLLLLFSLMRSFYLVDIKLLTIEDTEKIILIS